MLAVIAAVVFGNPLQPDEIVTYRTPDGVDLRLRHYRGAGPPVLLVHGMGVNHLNWDLRSDVSLAAWLRDHDWDVWIPELRGDDRAHRLRSWSFADHAERDLPAAIDVVLQQTGASQLHWVGHSMGGMLLYTTLAQRPDVVAAGVALTAPATFATRTRSQKTLGRMRWMFKGNAKVRRPRWTKRPRGVERDVAREFARTGLVPLPMAMIHEVATWLHHGRLVRPDGTEWIPAEPVQTPVLVVSGTADRVAHPDNVVAAMDWLPNATHVAFEGWGHAEVTVGSRASEEVYPLIEAFLRMNGRP